QIVKADMARMLELAAEVVRRAHALRTVLVALCGRMRAGGRTGLLRQLAHRPRKRGVVMDPVMRVDVGGLPSDELASASVLRAVFGEGFRAIDRAREELGRTPERSILANKRTDPCGIR